MQHALLSLKCVVDYDGETLHLGPPLAVPMAAEGTHRGDSMQVIAIQQNNITWSVGEVPQAIRQEEPPTLTQPVEPAVRPNAIHSRAADECRAGTVGIPVHAGTCGSLIYPQARHVQICPEVEAIYNLHQNSYAHRE